jgi:hypothetical protein
MEGLELLLGERLLLEMLDMLLLKLAEELGD